MTGVFRSAAGARAVHERYAALLDRCPVPAERLRLPTRHGETFVLAAGPVDAPPLVALHGSGATAAMWLGSLGVWAHRLRVYAVDMIGEPGFSAPSRPPMTGDAYAGWLTDVLDGLGVDGTSMVGVSLGGWLALDFAIRHPERVTRLVLLNPGGVGRRKVGAPVAAGLCTLLGGAAGRRRGLRLALGPEVARAPSSPDAARVRAAMADLTTLVFRHFRPRLGTVPRFGHDALGRLRMPVLAVLGARDAMLDAAQTATRLTRAVPGATVRVLPGSGHLLPDQTGAVLDFLQPGRVPGG